MYCCQKFEIIFFSFQKNDHELTLDVLIVRAFEWGETRPVRGTSSLPIFAHSHVALNSLESLFRKKTEVLQFDAATRLAVQWNGDNWPDSPSTSSILFSSKQSGDKTICLKGWRLNWPFRARSFCTFTERGSLHLLKLTRTLNTFVNARISRTQALNFKFTV